ncbi:MAG: hypothetical protein JWM68_2672 [Verrucomicrobiales bacterium]|nr:hypothetical protein [Verrucomicrobiales bacterium]
MHKAGRIVLVIIAVLIGLNLHRFRDGNVVMQYYDRWNGLIPLLGGIYMLLLAKGVLPRKPKNPEKLNEWRKKFGTFMTVAGPLMIVWGFYLVATAGPVREDAKPIMYRTQAGVPESDGWYLADSTGGHFKIKLPGPFNDFSMVGINAEGKKTETSTVGIQTQEKIKFTASLIKVEGGIPDKRKHVEDFLGAFRDSILSTRQIVFKNLTGTEAKMQGPRGAAVMRIIPTDSAFYMLIAEYPVAFESQVQELVPGFMDSLEPAP